MILYQDTEKELTLCDYMPLPSLKSLSIDSLEQLQDNLQSVLENSYIYHSELLTMAIESDMRKTDVYIRMAYKRQERKGK